MHSFLDESRFLRIGSAARLLGLCLSEATDVSLCLALIGRLLVEGWALFIDLSDQGWLRRAVLTILLETVGHQDVCPVFLGVGPVWAPFCGNLLVADEAVLISFSQELLFQGSDVLRCDGRLRVLGDGIGLLLGEMGQIFAFKAVPDR